MSMSLITSWETQNCAGPRHTGQSQRHTGAGCGEAPGGPHWQKAE